MLVCDTKKFLIILASFMALCISMGNLFAATEYKYPPAEEFDSSVPDVATADGLASNYPVAAPAINAHAQPAAARSNQFQPRPPVSTPPRGYPSAMRPPGARGPIAPPPGSYGRNMPPPGFRGPVAPPPGHYARAVPPQGTRAPLMPPPGAQGAPGHFRPPPAGPGPRFAQAPFARPGPNSGTPPYAGRGPNSGPGPYAGRGPNSGPGPYAGRGPNSGPGPYAGRGPNSGPGSYAGRGPNSGSPSYGRSGPYRGPPPGNRNRGGNMFPWGNQDWNIVDIMGDMPWVDDDGRVIPEFPWSREDNCHPKDKDCIKDTGPSSWIFDQSMKERMAEAWDDAIQAPSDLGEMPGGWYVPSVYTPNPIDSGDQLEEGIDIIPDIIRLY